MTTAKKPLLSVLTPVLNEQDGLKSYFERIESELLSAPGMDFEVILIDDGSTDLSWEMIQEKSEKDKRFHGISLSRNFGAHIALSAGLQACRGDAAVILACDLQDPPKVVLQFIAEWKKGVNIVWGHRISRQDQLWRIWMSNAFNALLKKFAMPKNSQFSTGSFFLADRKSIDAYRKYKERNRITFALMAATGFKQAKVYYSRESRTVGKSRWSLSQMLKAMYDAFIGFSYLPIRFITWAGILTSLFALMLSLWIVASWILENPIPGWTSIILLTSFFFGVQFFLMGIMGEYLFRIYSEVLRRPIYIIEKTTEQLKPFDNAGY